MDRVKKINPLSWHYRLYLWWKGYSEFDLDKSSSFRENWCHYGRVVLFWAPLGWFFTVPVWREVRPWLITVVLGLLFALVYGLIVNPIATLVVIVSTVLAIIITVAIFLLLHLLYIADESKPARYILFGLFWWIIIPIGGAAVAIMFLWEYVIEPVYFERHKWLWGVWSVTVLSIMGIFYLIGGVSFYMSLVTLILVLTACVLLALTVVFLVGVVLPELFRIVRRTIRRLRSRNNRPISAPREPSANVIDIARNLMESKRGSVLCPFIEVLEVDT